MSRDLDIRLMRLITAEASEPEAAEIRRLVEDDPEAAARLKELSQRWEGLEAPPPTVPVGFSGRVRARAAAEAADGTSAWGAMPARARVAATAAMVVGVALGYGIGVRGPESAAIEVEIGNGLEDETAGAPTTLAESYWTLVAAETDEDGSP